MSVGAELARQIRRVPVHAAHPVAEASARSIARAFACECS